MGAEQFEKSDTKWEQNSLKKAKSNTNMEADQFEKKEEKKRKKDTNIGAVQFEKKSDTNMGGDQIDSKRYQHGSGPV